MKRLILVMCEESTDKLSGLKGQKEESTDLDGLKDYTDGILSKY